MRSTLDRPALPQGRSASEPPEARGLRRDGVRLLAAGRAGLVHDTFRKLADYLASGDVVVVNTSATRPAAVDGRWRSNPVVVHLSNRLDASTWLIEVRRPDGPVREMQTGEGVELPGDAWFELLSPRGAPGDRLWRARLWGTIERSLRPVSYDYQRGETSLADHQTVFARPDDPTGASAEMPSAGRPFTHELVTELIVRGVAVAPITLHTGVSSLELDESPPPEWYRVPMATAGMVDQARRRGSRVVAVGTTVTRALETVTTDDGDIVPREGWTDLLLSVDRPARTVSGLITGWHPPDASHLHLLEAVAGWETVEAAYREAHAAGYLWHEFGDSCLFLP